MNHGKQSQMTPLTDMKGYLLLKCNYDSKLLDQKPPLFLFIVKCLIFLRNDVQVTLMSIEVNLFSGTSKSL